MKCVIKKKSCLLGLEAKALKSGVDPEAAKVAKCRAKFGGTCDAGSNVGAVCVTNSECPGGTCAKGCFTKLDAKVPTPPDLACPNGSGDAPVFETKVDNFVNDIITDLDPSYPVHPTNECAAGKVKCVVKKDKCILGVFAKAVKKGQPPDGTKLTKCRAKFGGTCNAGANLDQPCEVDSECPGGFCTGGCFSKLELTKPPCLTTGDAQAVEAKIDAFDTDIVSGLGGGAPTPTPVSTPTTTSTPGPGSCGNGITDGFEPCDASAPAATWNNCGPDFTCTSCNCACPTKLTFAPNLSDSASVLDMGWTGIGHRERVWGAGQITMTVSCGPTTRPCGNCTISGPIANAAAGAGELNNQRCTNDTSLTCTSNAPCTPGGGTCQFYFGAPVSLAAGGVSICQVNRFNGSISGVMNVETGADGGLAMEITASVYNGLAIDNPCPRCIGDVAANDGAAGGLCSGGTRNGLACDANATTPGHPDYGATSLDCPLSAGALIATLPLDLTSTTGTSTKTVTASSPTCSGDSADKCLCDTCNNVNQEPCDANTDCPDPPGPIGAICGGRRCIGGTNNGAACTNNTECPMGGICARPGEPTKASACLDDTSTVNTLDCADTAPVDGEGECMQGPVTQSCSVASGHAQRGCGTDGDCGGGSGSCEVYNRRCFLTGTNAIVNPNSKVGTTTLIANGQADTFVRDSATPTYASVFCVAPTGSTSVNNVFGLPGPARQTMRGAATFHP